MLFKSFTAVIGLCLALSGLAWATPLRRAISQDLMDNLERFTQFASGAYQIFCPAPLGTTLVETVGPSSVSILPRNRAYTLSVR